MSGEPTHEHALPQGYFMAASGDTLPFFDREDRALVLRFWPDGSVTWQLRGRDGEVLEPDPPKPKHVDNHPIGKVPGCPACEAIS